jgi:hypothetical protein
VGPKSKYVIHLCILYIHPEGNLIQFAQETKFHHIEFSTCYVGAHKFSDFGDFWILHFQIRSA